MLNIALMQWFRICEHEILDVRVRHALLILPPCPFFQCNSRFFAGFKRAVLWKIATLRQVVDANNRLLEAI